MKRLLTLCLILCAFLYGIEAKADSPRKVVVEEFTNTGCAPCASANPAFHQYIEDNFTKVIPVIFHADWPGSDPYNAYNPDMVTYRLRTYYASYAIQGVPHAIVAGNVQGFPNVQTADWATLKNAMETKSAETSPIDITVSLNKDGANGEAGIKILSSKAYNNVDLFVVVMSYISYFDAANGEKEFKWIPRKVLPADAGETINLAVGTELNKSYNFGWDTDWEDGSIYLVAFVQNKSTKEIYQGATSPYVMPTVALASVQAITNPYQKIAYGGTYNQNIVVTNPNSFTTKMTPSVNQEALPAGWTVTFEPTSADLAAGTNKTFVATVTNPSKYGLAVPTIIVKPSAEGIGVAQKAEVSFNVLVTGTKYAYYIEPLQTNNTYATFDAIVNSPIIDGNYAIMNMGQNPTPLLTAYPPEDFETAIFSYDYSNSYNARTFSTSNYYQYFGVGQMTAMQKMIEKGKKVVIFSEADLTFSSGTSGSSQGKTFYNTIGIGLNAGWTLRVSVDGEGKITGILPYDIIGKYPDNTPLVLSGKMNSGYNNNWPFYTPVTDNIKINDQSVTPILTYSDGKVGGIYKKIDNAAFVYLTCSFSGCPTTADRAKLLDFALAWTNKTSAVNDENNEFNMQVSPNPIASSSVFTYTINDLSNISINMVDVLGNTVRELATGFVSQGNYSVNLNAQGLASGTYYIIANINDKTSTIPVVINK